MGGMSRRDPDSARVYGRVTGRNWRRASSSLVSDEQQGAMSNHHSVALHARRTEYA